MPDALKDALERIAGFSLSQFVGPHDMALECVNVARAALSRPEPEPEAVQVPLCVRTAPERIWLQISDDKDHLHEAFPRRFGAEVTWCEDSAMDCEVEYVRADLAAAPQPPAQADQADCIRVDALRALSYGAGLTAGWNFCASDDVTGFESAQRQGAEALRVLKATNQPPAQAGARGDELPCARILSFGEVDNARVGGTVEFLPHHGQPLGTGGLLYARPAPAAPQAGEAWQMVPDELHNILTAGPAPWTDTRIPSEVWHVARAVYGTSDLSDEQRAYRTLQAAVWKLASQPMSREGMSWHPIQTAPSDEMVLVAVEFDHPGDWRIKTGYFDGESWQWKVFGGSWTPTRWMPLPAAPDHGIGSGSGGGVA